MRINFNDMVCKIFFKNTRDIFVFSWGAGCTSQHQALICDSYYLGRGLSYLAFLHSLLSVLSFFPFKYYFHISIVVCIYFLSPIIISLFSFLFLFFHIPKEWSFLTRLIFPQFVPPFSSVHRFIGSFFFFLLAFWERRTKTLASEVLS